MAPEHPSNLFSRRRAALGGWLIAAMLVATIRARAAEPPESTIDFSKGWFRPALTEEHGPLCEEVEASARQLFASGALLSELPWRDFALRGLETLSLGEDLQKEPIEPDPGRPKGRAGDRTYLVTHGRKLYIASIVEPGSCGGACERRSFRVSPEPFPADRSPKFLASLPPGSPVAPVSHLLRSGDDYYVAVIADDALQLLHLETSGEWRASCKVKLKPDERDRQRAVGLQRAAASIGALRAAVRGLTRGAGSSCGTMGTHWRWDEDVTEALNELLFRPRRTNPINNRGDSSYRADMNNLRRWASTGISEHEALQAYETRLEETARELARFYVDNFGLSPGDSREYALGGLTSAVSGGIRFYEYHPFVNEDERRLREAILEHRPMAEIRQIELTLEVIDGGGPGWHRHGESLLNAAVDYPEALAWLLELGADPNRANEFGKTPLMYAAQHDAVAAARLLLDAGADPNATTIFPADHCYYALSTASLTPLHYAVRYASAELIELLLDRGAITYIQSNSNAWNGTNDYPLDWLVRYNSPESEERNPNIADAEVARLAELLAVPGADEARALALERTLAAEEAYASGRVDDAYALLAEALSAAGEDPRALSDMSLVALRAGHPGQAADAALKVIAGSEDAGAKAGAWFNLGLACYAPDARHDVRYDDTFQCRYSKVYPFVRAWRLQPTRARAEKLRAVFADHATCVDPAEGVRYHIDPYAVEPPLDGSQGTRRHIYAWHPADVDIPAASIVWKSYEDDRPTSPELRARYQLGDFAISVYETDYVWFPVTIDGIECHEPRW